MTIYIQIRWRFDKIALAFLHAQAAYACCMMEAALQMMGILGSTAVPMAGIIYGADGCSESSRKDNSNCNDACEVCVSFSINENLGLRKEGGGGGGRVGGGRERERERGRPRVNKCVRMLAYWINWTMP